MIDLEFTNFKSFLNAVHNFTGEDLEKAKRLLKTEGKDIDSLDDIFINKNNELFELLPDGTLTRVNLYIATQPINKYSFTLNNYVTADSIRYKYHIYKCGTISSMFNNKKKYRYKINNRNDGTFYFTFTSYQDEIIKIYENQKINICMNCFKQFQKKSSAQIDFNNFQLEEFYKGNKSFFDFNISELEKGVNIYSNKNSKFWDSISKQIKMNRNYTCESCGYTAKNNNDIKFIQVHHTSSNNENYEEDNFQVLCIKCHANIDSSHGIIKTLTEYEDFISKKTI